MTDVQLLEHFVKEHDDPSFHALVVRHGPTVLRVCRRILCDPHEAEDAFQATFLVLVRKAPSIRDPEALGNWLYGVAYRVATRARRGAARRRKHEKQRAEMVPRNEGNDRPWDDLAKAVREELGGLPEPYRASLELCYLRGRSHEEAASELGWPLGTLKVRLVRGRKHLRERLDRRGISIAMGLLLLLLLPKRVKAVPEELVESTIQAMRMEASGGVLATDHRFSRSSRLARDVMESESSSRWMWLWLLMMSVSSFAATGSITIYGQIQVAEAEEFAGLPANLMDVLNVRCR